MLVILSDYMQLRILTQTDEVVHHYPKKRPSSNGQRDGRRFDIYYGGEVVSLSTATVQLISYALRTCLVEFLLADHLSNYVSVPLLELPANFCCGLQLTCQFLSTYI